MKKRVNRILAFMLCVLLLCGSAPTAGLAGIADWLSVTAAADDIPCGTLGAHIIWTLYGGTLYISGWGTMDDYQYYFGDTSSYVFSNRVSSIVIEDGITTIGKAVFCGFWGLRSVSIPSSVTMIDDNAFSMCTSLTSITIPDGVESIASLAFSGCTSLTSVTIGSSLTSIGSSAFYDCTSLASVYYTGTLAQWCGIRFDSMSSNPACRARKLYLDNQLLTNAVIPSGVTCIGDYAFSYVELTQATIPGSVKTIGKSAFYDCAALTDVTLSTGTTSIGGFAFCDCTGLTELAIPDSVLTVGEGAFFGCTGLTEITIPDSVLTVGECAFLGCTGLEYVTIGKGVTSIVEDAFTGCTSLLSFAVNKDNTAYCNDEIGALYNKDKTVLIQYPLGRPCATLSVPNSVVIIGNNAFYGRKDLLSLQIPDHVTSVGDYAFAECTSLTTAMIPDSVTSLGEGAFSGCSSLRNIVFGNGITSIGSYTFSSCSSLTFATLPDGITNIGFGSFRNCANLSGIHIPASAADIDSWAIYGCDNLEYICCDTEDCYAKTFAEANGIEFRVCRGHDASCAHEYTSEVTTAPSCTAAGVRTYTCTECGDSYTEAIPALDHAYESAVTTTPTCAAEGVRTYTCTRCTDSYTEVIDKIAHTPQDVTEPASCTANGRQYKKCGVCGETIGDVTVLPATGHTFGEWVTVTEPTTEAEGLQERVCVNGCGTKETQVLPKIPTKTVEDSGSGVTMTYPETAFEGEVELKIEQVFDGAAFHLIDLRSDKNVVFDITTVKDGVAVQPNGKVTVRIPVPAGFDPAKCMVYHVNTETGKLEKLNARYENGCMVFETNHFSIFAVVIEKPIPPTVAIRNFTENKTVDYRTTITFTADVTNGVPGGAVHWFVDGKDVGTGETYTVKEAKKSYTVQAKYIKGTDVLAETGTEKVTVKTGFFARIKAFFRALFGRLPKEAQVYLGVEFIERLLP